MAHMTDAPPHTKPFGIRQSLGKTFLAALEADFAKHGTDVITTVRDERPHDYLKIVISLLPDEMIADAAFEEMTDEQLTKFLDDVRSFLAANPAAAHGEGGEAEGG